MKDVRCQATSRKLGCHTAGGPAVSLPPCGVSFFGASLLRLRDLEDVRGSPKLLDLKGMPWTKLYTKYMRMGRVTMRKTNINSSSAHDGYGRGTCLDCGEMGKGFRKLKPPEDERLWKGRVGGEPGQRTESSGSRE